MLPTLLLLPLAWPYASPANLSQQQSEEQLKQQKEREWALQESDDNLATFTRLREGSALVEARHVATTPVRMGRVLAEIGDGSQCVAWMQRCKTAEILQREDENNYLGYVVLNMPWPLSDRDLVYRSKRVQGARHSLVIEQEAEPAAHPETRLVRMLSSNRFILTPKDDGGTRIIWEVFSDPRGNVKPKMVNGRIHKDTREDMKHLLKLLETKYADK
ncbi:MAG: START domain-containing protein [Pseudomonadales bacterium]